MIIALAGVALGLGVLFDHTGGYFWFYWIAPLLTLGLGGLLIKLVRRLLDEGRPARDQGPPAE